MDRASRDMYVFVSQATADTGGETVRNALFVDFKSYTHTFCLRSASRVAEYCNFSTIQG